jgi:hypothetical protein
LSLPLNFALGRETFLVAFFVSGIFPNRKEEVEGGREEETKFLAYLLMCRNIF